jgi:hypothetical protein
MGVEFELNI